MVPLPPSSVFVDDCERQHFDWFRRKTAPESNAFVSSSFWSHIVFQASYDEPAVRHAALALSAWHRFYEDRDESEYSFAVEQYNYALKSANTLLTKADRSHHDLSVVMTALIIFHCVQNCFNDYPTAESSLKTARKLAEDIHVCSANAHMKDIILTINRLDIHSITFSDASAPYRFPEVFQTHPCEYDVLPQSFDDIEQAFQVLLVILKDAFHIYQLNFEDIFLAQEIIQDPVVLATERSRCIDRLRDWWELTQALEDRTGRKQDTYTMALMRVYHTIAMLSLCRGTNWSELDWDYCMPHMVYVLDTISAILKASPDQHPVAGHTPFSVELGIICPLFFVAANCREPLVRRKSVSLMAEARRREGRWESYSAAMVAQRIIEIEEEGLGIVVHPSDIPECNRVAVVEPRVSYEKREVQVSFIIPAALGLDGVVREEIIHF